MADNEKGRITGIVSAIKEGAHTGEEVYTVISDRVARITSKTRLELFDRVEFDYVVREGVFENGDVKVVGSGKTAYNRAIQKLVDGLGIEKRVESIWNREEKSPLDKTAKLMVDKLGMAAREMMTSFVSGAPVMVRFHSDGDGASGATALYVALLDVQKRLFINEGEARWRAHKGISYDVEAFYVDSIYFNSFKAIERPILCIVDFGTALESNPVIDRAEKVSDIIWLDHHTIVEGFNGVKLSNYINPMNFGGTADFTAGWLACLFAEVISEVNVDDLKGASLISDFSSYGDSSNDKAVRYATILDFVTGIKDSTHYLDGPIVPSYLLKLLENKEKADSLYTYANDMMEDAIRLGIEKGKTYRGRDGITINLVDFEYISNKYYGYLLPGRYSSKLQGALEARSSNGAITMVTFRNVISMRVSKRIAESVKLLDIIERLKVETDFVDSGGGHKEAASIRVSDESNRELVVKLLLKEFGVVQK